ncbi:hypothetical protein MBT84_33550 [Streptomyces sp. MBT84]|nr:hypothetical protein [Streptomyces sp. MBT84]
MPGQFLLRGDTSTATIRSAPAIRADCSAARPTPPTPKTATVSPGRTFAAWCTAPYPVSTAQPSRAASASGTPSGAGSTQGAATTVSSANAATLRPGCRSVPSSPRRAWTSPEPFSAFAQSHTSPSAQAWQVPQEGAQLRTTPSPGATWVTPSPTDTTVPAPS